MFKFLTIAMATTMKGTIDQIDQNRVIVEMSAKDGHTHEAEFPIWIFPCSVKEGTVFWIDMFNDKVVIHCDRVNE